MTPCTAAHHSTISSCCHLLLLPSIFSSISLFWMSWFFASVGQSIGASASSSVLPMNIQGWFPLGLTGLISLQSKARSRVFSNTTVQKHQFFGAQPSLWFNSHISNESALHIRWPKYWSSSFSISPSNEYLELISFKIDWVDLAVQGTLKSLLQHQSSKTSILWS